MKITQIIIFAAWGISIATVYYTGKGFIPFCITSLLAIIVIELEIFRTWRSKA